MPLRYFVNHYDTLDVTSHMTTTATAGTTFFNPNLSSEPTTSSATTSATTTTYPHHYLHYPHPEHPSVEMKDVSRAGSPLGNDKSKTFGHRTY